MPYSDLSLGNKGVNCDAQIVKSLKSFEDNVAKSVFLLVHTKLFKLHLKAILYNAKMPLF